MVQPLQSVNNGRVKPLKDSIHYGRMMKNAEYLFSLDCDRLLCGVRRYAGLDDLGKQQYGGWEDSGKGIYYGHYLYACSMLFQSMSGLEDAVAEEAARRVHYILSVLKECQQEIALQKGEEYPECFGYLSASPMEELEKAEAMTTADGSHGAQYLPYYCHHKVMAGLSQVYRVFGDPDALAILRGMGDYFDARIQRLDPAVWERMLNTRRTEDFFMEFGGMQEVYTQLYHDTGEKRYLEVGKRFDRVWFRKQLLENDNRLGEGMQHSNTEIPCVLGMAEYYEATGEEEYRKMVEHFLHWMADGHQLPSGGLSGRSAYPDYAMELYHYPKKLYPHIMDTPMNKNVGSGESCCAHNMNRICEKALAWTGDAFYGDEWERRFVNCVLPQQNRENGMFLYNLNLKQFARKQWGTPEDSFWCCYGTGIEIFSSLTTGAYFIKPGILLANLYMPCSFDWSEQRVRVTQNTLFPSDSTVEFCFEMETSSVFTLCLRIPSWLQQKPSVILNGQDFHEAKAENGFLCITRKWQHGDRLLLELPFDLWTERMPDRPEYLAVHYGPNLLVACSGREAVFSGTEDQLLQSLKPYGAPCTFAAPLSGTNNRIPVPEHITFRPLHEVIDETYHGYLRVTRPVAEQIADVVVLSDETSMREHVLSGERVTASHGLQGDSLETGIGGAITFAMKAKPDQEQYLKLTFWGEDRLHIHLHGGQPVIRLFDLQVQDASGIWQIFCTQHLDGEYRDQFFDEIYPIPLKWTAGQQTLQFRLKAKGFHGIGGMVGRLFDRIQLHYYQD